MILETHVVGQTCLNVEPKLTELQVMTFFSLRRYFFCFSVLFLSKNFLPSHLITEVCLRLRDILRSAEKKKEKDSTSGRLLLFSLIGSTGLVQERASAQTAEVKGTFIWAYLIDAQDRLSRKLCCRARQYTPIPQGPHSTEAGTSSVTGIIYIHIQRTWSLFVTYPLHKTPIDSHTHFQGSLHHCYQDNAPGFLINYNKAN